MFLKYYILFVLLYFSCLNVHADGYVSFTISDGIDSLELKAKMESSITKILNEVNAAYSENRALNFSKMEVNERVQQSMAMLWENSPFICTDEEIVEHCLTTVTGYQIRNITLQMKPIEERDSTQEYQEAIINFDKQGNVESFYLSISMNLYMDVIKSDLGLDDLHHRQLILNYIECLRTAHNQKDISFIENALKQGDISTTTKVETYKNDGNSYTKIFFNKSTIEQYLINLRQVFKRNKVFKVNFDEIEVMRHPMNSNFYGVTLKIEWNANLYHDEGYLFQLWDFTNENDPQIHVTVWQPYMKGGKPLPKEEVFSLCDFDIKKKLF